ncbi:hypothetical protein V6B16_03700 [Salinimicrobium catena]|uniref:hypothetical protein n=1 Tax=Salinimicrobium catena TaxID=390640 RepID=UPI002FE46D34
MEHAVENFETIATNVFEEIRKMVQEVGDVEQVYLSEKTREGQIMTFLVKEDFPTTHQDYAIHIGSIMEVLPKMKYRIYGYSYAQRELEKGNLYFIKNCQLGKLVHNRSNLDPLAFQAEDDIKVLLKKAVANLENEIERINSFTEGIKFYRKRKEWSGAAFLIHQKIEWLYRCMENFAMGKPLICHKIKNHLLYAHPFIYGAGPIFNVKRRSDNQLLEVIDRAYTESRYHSAFDMTKREVKLLHERADMMENQVREIFGFRLDDCYELLAKDTENSSDESSKKEENKSIEKDENDLEILKKIILQELNAVKIISFGKRIGIRERHSLAGISEVLSFTHYDLLIVAKETVNIYPSKISNLISQKTDGNLATTIILTSSNKVDRVLQKGNEFVHRVLTTGTVIYSDPEFSFDVPGQFKVTAEKLEKMNREFFIRNHRASCFLSAADHVSGDDDATEISLQYQALQQICVGTIYVLLGLRPDCLKLEYLFDLCSNFSHAPDNCFPRWSPEDQRLFKKLINSPNEVRFRTSDRRSLVDVDILFSRSSNFLKEMEAIARKRIEELKGELKKENHEK